MTNDYARQLWMSKAVSAAEVAHNRYQFEDNKPLRLRCNDKVAYWRRESARLDAELAQIRAVA